MRRDDHVIDVETLSDEIVEHPAPIGSKCFQELADNPLAIPSQPEPLGDAFEGKELIGAISNAQQRAC